MELQYLIPHDSVPELMLAGNAELVFNNLVTKNHKTYRIKRSKKDTEALFVYHDRDRLGVIRNKEFYQYNYTKEAEAFKYLFKQLFAGTLNDAMQVMHTGRCCACYRLLTDPESIRLGIGPECGGRKKISKKAQEKLNNLFKDL